MPVIGTGASADCGASRDEVNRRTDFGYGHDLTYYTVKTEKQKAAKLLNAIWRLQHNCKMSSRKLNRVSQSSPAIIVHNVFIASVFDAFQQSFSSFHRPPGIANCAECFVIRTVFPTPSVPSATISIIPATSICWRRRAGNFSVRSGRRSGSFRSGIAFFRWWRPNYATRLPPDTMIC